MINTVNPTHTFTYAGVRVNVYHADKGEGIPRHEHAYSHATFCASGLIAVRKEGIERSMDKTSKPVNLVPNEWHEIEALEDGTVFINVFQEGKY